MTDKLQTAVSPTEALLRQQTDKLKTAQNNPSKLKGAADDFEALFVFYMLQSMRKTVMKSGLMDDGMGGEIMESMFDQELSRQIAAQSRLGIAEMLQQQYSPESRQLPVDKNLQTQPKMQELNGKMPLQKLPDVRKLRGIIKSDLLPGKPAALETVNNTSLNQASLSTKDAEYYLNLPLSKRISEFDGHIQNAAKKYRVDPEWVRAIIAAESAGNPHATSQKGAKGLMQLMDPTAKDLGVENAYDPRENIFAGTRYFARLLRAYDGNVEKALAGYNAGPGNVRKYGGVPPFKETQKYIQRVQKYYNAFSGNIAER